MSTYTFILAGSPDFFNLKNFRGNLLSKIFRWQLVYLIDFLTPFLLLFFVTLS